jgi:hypothetical protein
MEGAYRDPTIWGPSDRALLLRPDPQRTHAPAPQGDDGVINTIFDAFAATSGKAYDSYEAVGARAGA